MLPQKSDDHNHNDNGPPTWLLSETSSLLPPSPSSDILSSSFSSLLPSAALTFTPGEAGLSVTSVGSRRLAGSGVTSTEGGLGAGDFFAGSLSVGGGVGSLAGGVFSFCGVAGRGLSALDTSFSALCFKRDKH